MKKTGILFFSLALTAPAMAAQSYDFSQTGYVAVAPLQLPIVGMNGELNVPTPLSVLELPVGAEIAILELKSDPLLGDLIRLGLDTEESSGVPSDIWIRTSDLPLAGLVPYAPADSSQDESAFEVWKKKMTYCYRYVKQYLLQKQLLRQ